MIVYDLMKRFLLTFSITDKKETSYFIQIMRLQFALCLSLFQISNEKHLNNEEREIQNTAEVSYSGNFNLKRHS